jgi:hypothetical protein
VLVLIGGLGTSACSWQPYVATRAVRHVMGNRTRVHQVVPLKATLKPYRTIEVAPFENLVGEAMPMTAERYLNQRVAEGLRALPTSPQVVVIADSPLGQTDDVAAASSERRLRVEGFIDDFDTGSLPLRVAELGFNHMAVTARIRLIDKDTSQVIGSASFTAQNDRVTASTNGALNQLANRIRAFVESGYAR